MIKTSDARKYDQAIEQWIKLNQKQVMAARQWSGKKWIEGHREFKVTLYYCFERSRLITKANTLKKIDTSNRTKVALDKIAHIIGIDDMHFIEDHGSKVIANDGQDEMIVKIETTKLKTKEQIYESIR